MRIAIDGPAASGKGTLARRLAAQYGLPHLDTGLLYRATARGLIDRGHDPAAPGARSEAIAIAAAITADALDETRLRGREMGEAASLVAAIPEVRAALVDLQRRFAGQPGGSVLDGRDIGTVICPDADVKLFVTASAEERARRRHAELAGRGETTSFSDVLADIRRRDDRDAGRANAPLATAADAVVLDTTSLDVEAAFREAMRIVDAQFPGSRSAG